MRWLRYLQRTTSTGLYLPHLDGLRFLALFLVVVQMHTIHFIDEKFFSNSLFTSTYWQGFIMEGNHGVFLFFSISGFILGLPFAKQYMQQSGTISLKKYYLRRLIRLEPPYQLILLLLFIAQVWVLKNYTFSQLLPHYVASFFYAHNLVYDNFSLVMPVAWTLEVEVQFYIIAPLIFLIYKIRNGWMRLFVYSSFITLSMLYAFVMGQGVGNVFTFLFYFLGGVLLADAYVNNLRLLKNNVAVYVAGIVALLLFLFFKAGNSGTLHLVKYVAMLLLFHCVLINTHLQHMFSAKFLVVVGGMCYSVYLLHFAVLSAAGYAFLKTGQRLNNLAYVPGYIILFVTTILAASALYFLLVEKPFMQLKLKYWQQPARPKAVVATDASA